MPPKREHPVGRPRKNPKQRKSVPQDGIKELTPKRQSWAKLFNLPFEILELIFRYAAPLDYWIYRIFREFERCRSCLDPVYFVQSNIQPDNIFPGPPSLNINDPFLNSSTKLFKIPPDQNQEFHTFFSYDDFVRNVKRHAQNFRYARYRHIFIEVEVNSYKFGLSLYNILEYLKSERIECSLFMRYPEAQGKSYSQVFPTHLKNDIKSEQLLYGDSQLILDQEFRSIISYRLDISSLTKRYKFLNYPSDLVVDNTQDSLFYRLFLDPKNVIYKKSVQNLQFLAFSGCFDLFKRADKCLFTNLQTLDLFRCVSTRGHTFYLDKLSYPNLKSISIKFCGLTKISGCYFPNLNELIIFDDSSVERMTRNSPKTNIVNNDLSSLKILKISTKRIGQISGNTLKEDMILFNLSAMISDEGSFGDIPDIISSCETFVFDAEDTMKDTINSLFNELCDLSKLKKLRITNTGSKGINYLENKIFSNLGVFEFTCSLITRIPKLKMPSLRVFIIVDSNVETVNIQGMYSLLRIFFGTTKQLYGKKQSIFNYRNSWYDDHGFGKMFIISLERIPYSSRTWTIDLRYHESSEFWETAYEPFKKAISFIDSSFRMRYHD